MLIFNYQVTDEGVCHVIRNGSPIEKLILSGIPRLTDKSIFTMASFIPNTLQSLYISGCTRVSKQACQYLKVTKEEFPNLMRTHSTLMVLDDDQLFFIRFTFFVVFVSDLDFKVKLTFRQPNLILFCSKNTFWKNGIHIQPAHDVRTTSYGRCNNVDLTSSAA